MQIAYGIYPYCSLEGPPPVRVKPGEDWETSDLASVLEGAMRPGYRTVWIEDAPWGEKDWDTQVHRALARVSEPEYAIIRPVGERGWSRLSLAWTFDATGLLTTPVDRGELRARVLSLPPAPRPTEIFVRNPHIDNIANGVLDELADLLNPAFGATLYLDDTEEKDEAEGRMRLVFPRLTSFWTVRRLTRLHNLNEQSWEPTP